MIPHKYTAEETIATFERPANLSKQTNAWERKNPDQEEIRRALTCLDPSDREIWIKVGHALKSEGASLRELYLKWSGGDLSEIMPTNFVSEGTCAPFVRLNDDGLLVLEEHSPQHMQRSVTNCKWVPNITREFSGYTRIPLDGCFGESDTELQRLPLEIIGVTILGVSTRMKNAQRNCIL